MNLEGKEFQVIGTDGGLLEKPRTITESLITLGERIDIIVGPFSEGENFSIQSLPYNRMTSIKLKQYTYATVNVGERKPSVASIPSSLRTLTPLADQKAEVTRKIKFSVGPTLKNGLYMNMRDQMKRNMKISDN